MRTSYETKICFSDMDCDSKLSFGKMVDIMQNCMNIQSESLGVGVEHQIKTKRAWLLSSWQIEIGGHFRYNEDVIATTWPNRFRGAAGERSSVIVRKDNPSEYLIKAESVWALFDFEKQALTRITEEDRAPYECEEMVEMDYVKGKIKRPEHFERRDEFTVRKYHLDFNQHMNNAWHIKLAEEFVDDYEKVHKIRIEYKMQAILGEKMIAFVAEEENRLVVELRNEEDNVYSITEFGYSEPSDFE